MGFRLLITAAIISLVGAMFHGFIGSKIYMETINKGTTQPVTKSLSLVSWHVFTIFLFISASTIIHIAYNPKFGAAAYPVIADNLLGVLLFVFLGLTKHRMLLEMPGAYLMGSTALLAWLGVVEF